MGKIFIYVSALSLSIHKYIHLYYSIVAIVECIVYIAISIINDHIKHRRNAESRNLSLEATMQFKKIHIKFICHKIHPLKCIIQWFLVYLQVILSVLANSRKNCNFDLCGRMRICF